MNPDMASPLPPWTKAFSFRTTKRRPLNFLLEQFDQELRQFGFQRDSETVEAGVWLSEQDLEGMRMAIVADLPPEVVSKLRPLSSRVIRRLTQKQDRSEWKYLRSVCDCWVKIDFCFQNSFPVVSLDLWRLARPQLRAGFVSLKLSCEHCQPLAGRLYEASSVA